MAQIPREHLDFLSRDLKLYFEASPYLFVHAGVRPGVGLVGQSPEDLLWIREEFLSAEHGFPSTVVFGHTPLRDVWFGPRRKIGLDTGCGKGGFLTALELPAMRVYESR